MEELFLFKFITENNKGWVDYINIFFSILSTCTSIGIAIWALKISQKQNKISEHQSNLQSCSFIYDSFIKEKQEKLIELRKLYLNFKDECTYFLSTIFPISIGKKDQQIFEIPKFDNNDIISYYSKVGIFENSEDFLKNGEISSFKLYTFLKNNEVFLKDNLELFEDLKTVSKAFYDIFNEINNNSEDKKNSFITMAKIIDKIGDSLISISCKEETIQELIIGNRKFFYNFMHYRLILSRHKTDGTKTGDNLLYMINNTIFKMKAMEYTPENIEKWSKDENIAFNTEAIFQTWFDTWLNYIDNFFYNSFNNINKVINNKYADIKPTDKTKSSPQKL